MTGIRPDQPWQLQHPPEVWQQILHKAQQDFHHFARTKGDPEAMHQAMEAMKDANEALGVYDSAAAGNDPGDSLARISEGYHGGLEGLGNSASDLVKGIASTIFHPINTLQHIPSIPGELKAGMTSDDPAQVGRTVGNIGGMLASLAKSGSAGTGRMTGKVSSTLPGPTVGGSMASAAGAPFRAVGDLMKRPGLKNADIAAHTKALEEIANQKATEGPLKADILDKRGQLMDTQLGDAPTKSAMLEANLDKTKLSTNALQDIMDRNSAAAPFKQSMLEANDYTTRAKAYEPTWPEEVVPPEAPGAQPPTVRPTIEPAGPQNARARALKKALDGGRNSGG